MGCYLQQQIIDTIVCRAKNAGNFSGCNLGLLGRVERAKRRLLVLQNDNLDIDLDDSHIFGLLTQSEVKMVGYWPSFFACLWTKTELRSINSQKKERGQYPAIVTEQAWIKGFLLYGFQGTFSCGARRVVPSGQDSSILSAHRARNRIPL